jgi:predicted transcriptional regulator YdeE
MQYERVDREALALVGVETPASNEDPAPIGELWARFIGEGLAQRIPGALDGDVWAVYCEYEGDHTQPYTFFLGCRVPADTRAPAGMVRRDVPGGAFARVAAHGEQPRALIEAWQAIWELPLDRAYLADYERHPVDDPGQVEIFVGIR